MNNYQELNKNLKDLKLYQISIKLSEYIEKINENKIGVAEALLELTNCICQAKSVPIFN